MRKLLFAFLNVLGFFRKIKLKLTGKTEDDIHVERVVSGKAWDDFCDQLKLAGNVLKFSGTPQNAFDQAEGLRYLSRLTRAGLEAFVEYADPSFPVLKRMAVNMNIKSRETVIPCITLVFLHKTEVMAPPAVWHHADSLKDLTCFWKRMAVLKSFSVKKKGERTG